VKTLRVGVVEDHPVYRDGLAAAFAAVEDIELAGAVGTVRDALALLEGSAVDVLLLDLGLPDGSGLDVLSTIRARHRGVAVVVLTMSDDRRLVLEAVRAGAHGYLLKGAGRVEIADAVRRAAAGGAVFDAMPASVVMAAANQVDGDPVAAYGLTPRESDVLRLVAQGLGNEAIATRLGVSGKTVRNQVSAVLSKLGVRNRAEAAMLVDPGHHAP
jgi:DNA-binding NarL/FixJ family response regulator